MIFSDERKKNLTCIPSLKHQVSTSASSPADSRITASGTVTTVTSQPNSRDSAARSGRRRWFAPRRCWRLLLVFFSTSPSFSLCSPVGSAGGSTHCFYLERFLIFKRVVIGGL